MQVQWKIPKKMDFYILIKRSLTKIDTACVQMFRAQMPPAAAEPMEVPP